MQMDGTLLLLGSPSGDSGGGGVPSDWSTTAESILTMAKEDNNQDMVMSAEASSSYLVDDDDELELGLGLSIGGGGGGGGGGGLLSNMAAPCWGQYARILTAKDLPNSVKNPNFSNSGDKRTATDSVSSTSVVGWPPVRRAHWMPTLANQSKSLDEQSSSIAVENKTIESSHCCRETKGVPNKGYLPVKVNMDGALIGRKVDLNAHSSYETLAQTLESMFCRKWSSTEAAGPSKILDGTSEFVLTYKDKDGNCMLVGDVPWQMFLSSVKRLRIMRNSESNKLGKHKHTVAAPMCQEKNARRRTDAI